ncbi:MAG: hypothetical protein KAU50_08260, partial [Candidatus Marinimicrobia bacterium]|nr:hypothetical protein [Candidatus Neomarinimicrobiota bacterium]
EQRIRNTRSMFVGNWFRDVDGRTNQPIILKDHYDVMMLTPLTCGIATPEQAEAIRPMMRRFTKGPHLIQWPPGIFTFSEAAWNAGSRMLSAEAVAGIADRVCQRTDARTVLYEDDSEPFAYRVPGVANEFWPKADRPGGGENYGWGATLPMFIIRNIIGFRESENLEETGFILAPAFPGNMAVAGKRYTCARLQYRDMTFRVTYTIQNSGKIVVNLESHSRRPRGITVTDKSGTVLLDHQKWKTNWAVSFEGKNDGVYQVSFR